MHKKLLPVLLAATFATCGLRAEDTNSASTNTPATTAQPAASTAVAVPTVPRAPAATTQIAPAPNQVIYSPRLPSPTELTNVAAAQGLTIEQINQTANQVTVIYRNANGQTSTVAYQLLPTGSAGATTVVVPTTAPTVIYQAAPSAVYYDTYPYDYWPRYYYPPVSLSLGFGYYHGWGRGYWGGGHWGGHHWR